MVGRLAILTPLALTERSRGGFGFRRGIVAAGPQSRTGCLL